MKKPLTRRRFGEILVGAGVITEKTLCRALAAQKIRGGRLGEVLEDMGIVTGEEIATVLSAQFSIPRESNLTENTYPPEILEVIDSSLALERSVFPLRIEANRLHLAMSNPLDVRTQEDIACKTGLSVVPHCSALNEVRDAIICHYLRGTVTPADWWQLLIVDHQINNRAGVCTPLRNAGYGVVEADNGANGLSAAFKHAPHLIITELHMPRVGGQEMLKDLRRSPETREIPVVALSMAITPEMEAHLLRSGFHDVYSKPMHPVRLQARIEHVLRCTYGERETTSAPVLGMLPL